MEANFYKTFYEIEKKHWLMRTRRRIIYDVLDKYILTTDSKPKDIKLLDFGCAGAYFLGELQQQGYQGYGLDSYADAIEFGQKQGVKNLAVISGKTINFPDQSFNVALLMDVLEHLEDPSWALKEIERVLKPGGFALVTVPAFPFLWGVMDEAAQHFRRYTIPTLTKAVTDATHLSLVRKSYYNTFLFPPIAAVRLASRWFGIKGRESDFDLSHPSLDKIFFGIINIERLLMRYLNYPFGVSILMVLRKPEQSV